jgi:peptide/nickel transport system permease protein
MTAHRTSERPAAVHAGRAPARRREWLSVLARAIRTSRGAVGLGIGGAVILLAVIGPSVAPHPATAFVSLPFSRPSGGLPLGADVLGRDVLSRTLNGGWQLLLMAAAATALGVVAGTACGVTAAYVGGWADHVVMRAVDIVLAFPPLIFALLLVSVLGPKVWLIVLAVGISHAPQVARVTRAAGLDVCERDFVKAAQILGIPGRKILSREVLPSLTSVLMVEVGLRLTYSILIIAGLSFLGFGLQPPSPNWGQMINENRVGLATNPWGVLAPTILIALLTIGINTFTDAVARSSLGVGRSVDDPEALEVLATGAQQ